MSNYSVTNAQVLRQTTKPSLGYRTIWTVQQDEVPLYGSSRLGLRRFSNATTGEDVRIITVDSDVTAQQISQNPIVLSDGNDNPVTPISVTSCIATRGNKFFELSNHLGNVLTVITDRKVWNTEGDIGYYSATVSSATDYYPFGMAIRGRKYNTEKYRFGFNGKENDGDWGSEMMQDYGFRVYSPSICRFLSVDPLTASYPWYTPYQFAGNMPIWAIDLDGGEQKYANKWQETHVVLWGDIRDAAGIEFAKYGQERYAVMGYVIERTWAEHVKTFPYNQSITPAENDNIAMSISSIKIPFSDEARKAAYDAIMKSEKNLLRRSLIYPDGTFKVQYHKDWTKPDFIGFTGLIDVKARKAISAYDDAGQILHYMRWSSSQYHSKTKATDVGAASIWLIVASDTEINNDIVKEAKELNVNVIVTRMMYTTIKDQNGVPRSYLIFSSTDFLYETPEAVKNGFGLERLVGKDLIEQQATLLQYDEGIKAYKATQDKYKKD